MDNLPAIINNMTHPDFKELKKYLGNLKVTYIFE